MRIRVTQDHIDRGVRCESKSCPLALSVNDLLTGGSFAMVGLDRIFICHPNGKTDAIDIPADVSQFREDFDKQRLVSPAEFDLPFPVET